jgi:Tol biopolymer transport system component
MRFEASALDRFCKELEGIGKGLRDIYQKASDGSGSEEVLFESAENKYPTSLSPDGRFLAFTNQDTKANTKQDIWILPLFGERKAYGWRMFRMS